MKSILVPTDFTDSSIFAINAAVGLSRKLDAELILLHVLEDPEDADELADKVEQVLKMTELEDVVHHFNQVTGDLIESITNQPADIIVMGSEGANGLESFFVGTNSEKVAKKADCPVIVVKAKTDLTAINKIVFPTNMNREDDQMIEELKFVQELFGASVHLIKVFDDTITLQRDVEKRLRDFAEFHQISDYAVAALEGIDEGDMIMGYAEKVKADIILMATHDRKGLDRVFAGHISGEVINESTIPIWTRSIELPTL